MLNDILMSLSEAQAIQDNLPHRAISLSYLASQVAQMYSVVYLADDSSEFSRRSAINPFQNAQKGKVVENIQNFQAAFLVDNLYVDLKNILLKKGFVVKTNSTESEIDIHSYCKLAFYPGISYVFVPRADSTQK